MPNPHPRVDWTGRQFNRWTVLARMPGRRGKDQAWLCRCACGTEKAVLAHNMKTGVSKSCGCYAREFASSNGKKGGSRPLPGNTGSRNALLCRTKAQARNRGLVFALTSEEAFALYAANCFYCEAAPAQKCIGWRSARTLPFIYNGIDRIDSTQGYLPGNVVSCCGKCNQAKNDFTLAQFEAWIEQVYLTMQRRRTRS